MVFDDSGRQFAAGDYSGTIRVWNVEDGKERARLRCNWFPTAITFDHDGSRLACGSDSEVRVWTIPDAAEILHLRHGNVVNRVLFSRDNRFLLTHSQEGTLRLWDISRGAEINRIPLGSNEGGRNACFSPDSRFVAAQDRPHQVQTWSIGYGDLLCQVREGTGAGVAIVALGNKYLATTSPGDNTMRVWAINGRDCIKAFDGRGSGKLAFSPQAKYVAAGSNGNSSTDNVDWTAVHVYKVEGLEAATIRHETKASNSGAPEVGRPPSLPTIRITSLAFSPDDVHLATASSEGTIRVTALT